MTLRVFELEGRNDLRYSLFSWRTRLALAHKKLAAEFVPVRLHDKERIAFSGGATVPILCDGDLTIRDSWRIACYLDEKYPDRGSLFGGDIGRGLTLTFSHWVDRTIVPVVVSHLAIDAIANVHNDDRDYYRQSMEKAFGDSLERLAQSRDLWVEGFRNGLSPLRRTLRQQPFIAGKTPAYADFVLFSVLHWAELMSSFKLLASDDDIIMSWKTRLNELAVQDFH